MTKIMVVDDDLALLDVISFTLRKAGFDVISAQDGREAIQRWQEDAPDLIILDINLPKLDGLKVCQHIRQESDVPIIMLSVRSLEDDIVTGLKLGADDYIVKPFSPRQLIARIEAVLRRSGEVVPAPAPIKINDFVFDASRHIVFKTGEEEKFTRLTLLECKLLEILLLHKNRVLSAEALIDQIWGYGKGDRTMLKQLIYRLRQKLDALPDSGIQIETIAGVGYSLTVLD